MEQGNLPHLVHSYSQPSSSWEDPSASARVPTAVATAYGESSGPSAVATASAIATESDDGESSGVDELLENFVDETEQQRHDRLGW